MSNVRGVLFDFGNTLFAHATLGTTIAATCDALVKPQTAQWADALAGRIETAAHTVGELRHSRDLDADVWLARWHVLYALGDDEVPGLGVALYAAMHDPLQWLPYARTAETLGAIHAGGVPIAIVSNTGWDVRAVFVAHHLDQFVDAFVLSYEVGVMKPDATIFHHACNAMGVPARSCLMVGDDARTDSGAVAAGLRTLLLPALAPGTDNGVAVVAQIVTRD